MSSIIISEIIEDSVQYGHLLCGSHYGRREMVQSASEISPP